MGIKVEIYLQTHIAPIVHISIHHQSMFLDYGMEIDIIRLYIETNKDTETLPRQDFLADFQAYEIHLQHAAAVIVEAIRG